MQAAWERLFNLDIHVRALFGIAFVRLFHLVGIVTAPAGRLSLGGLGSGSDPPRGRALAATLSQHPPSPSPHWLLLSIITIMLLIWVFTASVLRMPLYAALALALVVASFPVAFAFYSGPLASSKAPILALLSLYLVLGIGVDAIFVLSNSYALAEQDARRTHGRTHGRTHAGLGGAHGHGGGRGGGLGRRAASEAAVLVRALRHSVGVTGLSTMTTAVAFGASVASPITTIRQFALFQTSVVRVAA